MIDPSLSLLYWKCIALAVVATTMLVSLHDLLLHGFRDWKGMTCIFLLSFILLLNMLFYPELTWKTR